ncbi:hypothetical protein DFJ73DRAFT_764992 [Zopfochytrium polystomum]|nr:hypothetical protein DFJ73DRAFT_764992 [Zopfochytrium polystomum]
MPSELNKSGEMPQVENEKMLVLENERLASFTGGPSTTRCDTLFPLRSFSWTGRLAASINESGLPFHSSTKRSLLDSTTATRQTPSRCTSMRPGVVGIRCNADAFESWRDLRARSNLQLANALGGGGGGDEGIHIQVSRLARSSPHGPSWARDPAGPAARISLIVTVVVVVVAAAAAAAATFTVVRVLGARR